MALNIKGDPLVTVIIPVYNGQETIKKTIESVQRQTYSNFELLVVDNGSTDDTTIIVSNLVDSDPRIRLIHSKKGRSIARNVGLGVARGKYINFLDADDEFTSEHLERSVTFLNSHPEFFAYSEGAEYINADGKIVKTKTENSKLEHLKLYNIFEISALLFKRESSYIPFIEELSHNEDWLFWAQNLNDRHVFQNNEMIGSKIYITGQNTMSDIDSMVGSEIIVLSYLNSNVKLFRRVGLLIMFLNSRYVNEEKFVVVVGEKHPFFFFILKSMFRYSFLKKIINNVVSKKIKMIQEDGLY